jgi:aryl-alcohol dehydrogenase-like predicted oxidoreductase
MMFEPRSNSGSPFLTAEFGPLGPVCRLGLATRGTGGLSSADVRHAIDRGINFLNWCGSPDALSETVATLGPRRREVAVCVQFEARTAAAAEAELERILVELRTEYVDVLTFYYVEAEGEWQEIIGPGGALAFCREAKSAGRVRMLGLTSHQRPLAARWARSGLLDMLMVRYNAAHRGAEREVFPVTEALGMPVVTYTALRWGALLQPTRDDPPGFAVPRAPTWYRFALQNPAATVVVMAPESGAELEEDLTVLEAAGPLSTAEYEALAAHGLRVWGNAGSFP